MQIVYNPRSPESFPAWDFPTIDVDYEPVSRSVWMSFKASCDPCFTFQTLNDMADLRESLRGLFASPHIATHPVHYVALASRKPGVFNLGGDLAMFAKAIRDGEGAMLRAYAHACIDVVYGMAVAYDLPVVTLAAIAGQALGGGLEAALAQDFLFADETAMLGVPEVAFNTFPGMGAVTLLTRRIGASRTEQVIVGGDVFSGRQMLEMGVVDRCAPAGGVVDAALAWMIEGGDAQFQRRRRFTSARRHCFPVTFDELIKIVDVWTDTSCAVTARDLRHMDRLVSAQRRMAAA